MDLDYMSTARLVAPQQRGLRGRLDEGVLIIAPDEGRLSPQRRAAVSDLCGD